MALPKIAEKLVESFGGSSKHVYESLPAVDQNSNEIMVNTKSPTVLRQDNGALKYAFLSIIGSFVLVTVSVVLGVTSRGQSTLPQAHTWWPESQ